MPKRKGPCWAQGQPTSWDLTPGPGMGQGQKRPEGGPQPGPGPPFLCLHQHLSSAVLGTAPPTCDRSTFPGPAPDCGQRSSPSSDGLLGREGGMPSTASTHQSLVIHCECIVRLVMSPRSRHSCMTNDPSLHGVPRDRGGTTVSWPEPPGSREPMAHGNMSQAQLRAPGGRGAKALGHSGGWEKFGRRCWREAWLGGRGLSHSLGSRGVNVTS